MPALLQASIKRFCKAIFPPFAVLISVSGLGDSDDKSFVISSRDDFGGTCGM